HRSVESHVALNFLQDLVNVTVQHCDRAEAFQISERAFAVTGPPAPLRINCPKWDVREHDNRSIGSETFHVGFEPFKLVVSKLPYPAGLQIQNIDESDEMDAVLVEAVPTGAFSVDRF